MIDSILHFSIKHRWLVVAITLALSIYGFFALKKLPIDAVPDITNNQVQINTLAEGYSPTEVEKLITYPIEYALTGIPGLESTRSLSRNGFSQVTAIFGDHVDIYFARQQIGEKLAEAKDTLPTGIEPKMGPISTGLGEVYMWTVEYEHPEGDGAKSVDGLPGWQSDGSYLTPEKEKLTSAHEIASYLRTVQDWIIKPQLRGIPGLAEVDSIGGYVKQYHVEADPLKMQAYHVTFQDIIEALEKNNTNIGAGYVEYRGQSYVVKGDGRLQNRQDIAEVVIKSHQGTPVHIKDIADITLGRELRYGSATENGKEIVIGTAMMLIGANSRTVSQEVGERIQQINKTLPPDIQAKTILNRTQLVDATISTVTKNLSEGALLVIAILFLMLGNFRAAFIAAMIIPLSMLLTAIGMNQVKISGNLMSLGALDFGLIVDGVIIITENCLSRLSRQQRELGRALSVDERLATVLAASQEMIRPTVFGQLIIMIVYIPLLTFSGIEGKMFEPMALTVLFALAAAFLLSITFVPAMIALCVKPGHSAKENWVVIVAHKAYAPLLKKSLQHPVSIILGAVCIVIGSFILFGKLGQEFVPTLDEGDIALHAVRIPSTSLSQSTEMQKGVERTLAEFPEVAFVFSKTGTAEMASDPMPPNVSDTFVMLKPKGQWPDPSLNKETMIARMEEELWKQPGNNYEFTQPIEMRFNELIAGVRSDVAVKIFGDDFDTMIRTGNKVAKALNKIPGAADVKVSQTDGLPILDVQVDSKALERLGANRADVLEVLGTAVGGQRAGVLFEGDKRYDILVQLPEALRTNIHYLNELPISFTGDGGIQTTLPLKEVAHISISEGLNEINRENGKRVVIVEANVRGSDIGSFVSKAKEKISQEVAVPPGNWLGWGGQFENLLMAQAHLQIVVPICFALIFLLLCIALNDIRLAAIVFSGVPFAISGGIFMLWYREIPFSVSAAVGFIALSGIAVLNGLVMLTCIQQNEQKGLPVRDAIFKGAISRLRPVLMTALVASLGFLPMAIATGTGAEVQKPLATVVIGGLISSTVLTLFVLPSLCLIGQQLLQWQKKQVRPEHTSQV